jgi:hypothetical protein
MVMEETIPGESTASGNRCVARLGVGVYSSRPSVTTDPSR